MISTLIARLPRYPLTNRAFSFVCTAIPAALGSTVSFVYHGGAIWCAAQVLSGRRALSRDRPMLWLAAAIYVFVFANLLSTALNTGLESLKGSLPTVAFLGFPFSYSIWAISRKREIAEAAVLGSALSCYAGLAFAIFQFHFLSMRAEGGAGNALVFATVLCIAASVALAGIFLMETRWRAVLGGAIAAALIALVYSESRIAWVAFAICALVILFAERKSILAHLSRRTVLAMAAAAIVVVLVAALPVSQRLGILLTDWRDLQEFGDYSTSLGVRVALWHIGIDAVRHAPLLGHGQAATAHFISEAFRTQYALDQAFTHFHNGFLTIAVEAGLLGVAAALAMFVLIFATAISVLRRESDPMQRFGALMLLIVGCTYLTVGSANLMLGHDILDAVFLITLALGTYLASGRSMMTAEDEAASPAS